MRTWRWVVVSGAMLAAGGVAVAQQEQQSQMGHEHMAQMGQAGGGGSKALHQQMMKSSKKMQQMKMTGNFDHDFVMSMRQHHQDGIEMAQMAVKNAQDEKVREMAQRIVDTQEKDLKEFDAWLAQHKAATEKKK